MFLSSLRDIQITTITNVFVSVAIMELNDVLQKCL